MTDKICAVSVDLDPLTAYYEIHGLGKPPKQVEHTILNNALPRFQALFEQLEIPATLFIVGQELEGSKEAQATLKQMVAAGHELGNHTYTHPYDLNQLPEAVIEREIQQAHDVIVESVGKEHAPLGFRTPGYHLGPAIARVLSKLNYAYDTSMFPSPPYYAAKMAVMAAMALRGRRSGAVMGDPRGLTCPPDPYRLEVERPWRRGKGPLIELPVATVPGMRLPAIGTLLALAPPWVRRFIVGAMRTKRFFNFELHGIDLSDAIDDRIPTELAGRQPDLRVPYRKKRDRFIATIEELKSEYRFVTMRE
ncbi:MAG: polysaccharide deacetylase family protein, partial [Deltaproteobacteria bacterium]|nr:polysaccharide deacetylase family protein [Deltaproteobacteria bacterium]